MYSCCVVSLMACQPDFTDFWENVPSGKSIVALTFGIENTGYATFIGKDLQPETKKKRIYLPLCEHLGSCSSESFKWRSTREGGWKVGRGEGVHEAVLGCCGFPALDLGALVIRHRKSGFHLSWLLFFKVSTEGEKAKKGVEIGSSLGL